MHKNPEKYLSKLIAQLCASPNAAERFFGINAACMTRVVSDKFPTMATDGVTLYVNPTFLLSRSDSANRFTLIHEAFHKVARHSIRMRELREYQRETWHQACDYAVNLALDTDREIRDPMPDDGLIDKSYVDLNGKPLNAERIMKRLFQKPESGESDTTSESGDDSSNQNTGGNESSNSAETSDNSDQESNSCGELLPAPADYDESEAAQEVAQAAQLAKAAGSLPGYVEDLISESIQPDKSDWRDRLRIELARAFDKSDYSRRVPNQRYAQFGGIMPRLNNPAINKIAIVSDVSGSMSARERVIAINQAKTLVDDWNPLETLVLHHNTRVVHRERLCAGMPLETELNGSGGTYFQPVLDELSSEQPDAVLWFTDCIPCDSTKEPDFPVVFLGTDWASGEYHKQLIGFGRFIDVS